MKYYLQRGPITVTLQITGQELYSTGIITRYDCRPGYINYDHTAVIIGYGSQRGREFWVLKNSWGSDWGENGFFRVEITNDAEGACGINYYPIIGNFD